MSKSQRTKGAVGERELCHLLHDNLGVEAKRNLLQTRESGCDIVLNPYNIEVKRRARIGNVYDWYEQAERSCANSDNRPVVAFRADNKKWMVMMSLDEFCLLAREEIAVKE